VRCWYVSRHHDSAVGEVASGPFAEEEEVGKALRRKEVAMSDCADESFDGSLDVVDPAKDARDGIEETGPPAFARHGVLLNGRARRGVRAIAEKRVRGVKKDMVDC
jgi:hypothetical protein